jgi:Family of unknown function (DUF5343)
MILWKCKPEDLVETDKKKPIPPYISYKTLRNFLDRFAKGVPSRVDRSLMSNMSGAAQSQITVSLKFLGLIDEHGHPTDRMGQLVEAQGEARQTIWSSILRDSYSDLFRPGFNLQTVTAKLLREQFEKTAASGETLNRCIAFFLTASTDAGIAISPFIKEPRKPRTRAGVTPKTRTAREKESHSEPVFTSESRDRFDQQAIQAQESLLLWGLFKRLPKPGSIWPRADREQWTVTLQNVLGLEYPDQ